MFPLQLLPTVPDNLDNMPARHSLRYQNAFMKNALLRSLNVVHAVALTINVGTHPVFHQFMEYIGMVCDMTFLHFEGDQVFFKSLSDRQCHPYRPSNNQDITAVCKSLKSLRHSVSEWDKVPSSYKCNCLLGALRSIGAPLVDIFGNRVHELNENALPKGITDQELRQMIIDNIVWLVANSDITVLLPFCTSHHDPKTSKFWPPITADAIKAMPDLAQAHPNFWIFAPFDPVTKRSRKFVL